MKKITAFLGLVGVVCLSGCSDTATLSAPDDTSVAISSDAGNSPSSSSSVKRSSSSAAKPSGSVDNGTGEVVHDTIHTQVVINSAGSYETPNYSSGVFCWNEPCEAVQAPASSSSIASIDINMSSSQPTPPVINGNQMLDQRDQKSYPLVDIAGKKWMAQNINYAVKSGYYCSGSGSDDMCATYGGYYSYSGALKACPDGWRLPTEAEFEAAIESQEWKWWNFGGRFKLENGEITEFGDDKKLGYLWVADNKYVQLKNYADDGTKEYEFHAMSERGYNVRCVQGE